MDMLDVPAAPTLPPKLAALVFKVGGWVLKMVVPQYGSPSKRRLCVGVRKFLSLWFALNIN